MTPPLKDFSDNSRQAGKGRLKIQWSEPQRRDEQGAMGHNAWDLFQKKGEPGTQAGWPVSTKAEMPGTACSHGEVSKHIYLFTDSEGNIQAWRKKGNTRKCVSKKIVKGRGLYKKQLVKSLKKELVNYQLMV